MGAFDAEISSLGLGSHSYSSRKEKSVRKVSPVVGGEYLSYTDGGDLVPCIVLGIFKELVVIKRLAPVKKKYDIGEKTEYAYPLSYNFYESI